MLSVNCRDDRVYIGERFSVSFQRTLRLPDDGRTYPLPPGLGAFPVQRVADFAGRVPTTWRERGGFFIPLYQREALWLQFEAAPWKPNAVMVGVGGINALTGGPWSEGLEADPQNYIVCPDQPWLDGINAGDGVIRQFVAAGLGAGDTVEEQLTGAATFGGIQLRVYEPKPGRFPDRPPPGGGFPLESAIPTDLEPVDMGIAAGGRMRQKIYPDLRGIETWDEQTYGTTFIHLVNSRQYRAITGEEPPPSPITARLYTELGLPWFDLYDDDRGDLPPAPRLGEVKSLREREAERGAGPDPQDAPVPVDPSQIVRLEPSETPESESAPQ